MIRFVFVVLLFAAMVYLLVRLLDRRSFGGGGKAAHGPTMRGPKTPPPRTIAPDDDEQFLRDLDKRRKEQNPPD